MYGQDVQLVHVVLFFFFKLNVLGNIQDYVCILTFTQEEGS